MMQVTSTPGKLILMGEHAAVYRRPALVAAVGLRLRVCVSSAEGGEIEIDLPQIDHRDTTDWKTVLDYTRSARSLWERYAESPSAAAFEALKGDDPAHLIQLALGEAAAFLEQSDGPACRLRIDSELPIGSGFGSSAAIAVGVITTYLTWRGASVTDDDLHRLSLEVERRQHGMPSGIDNATVLHGGIVWARKSESGSLDLEAIRVDSPLLKKLRIFHSGAPTETTGAVVAAVRDWGEARPRRFASLLDRMQEHTVGLHHLLIEPAANSAAGVELIRGYEGCLEELGVVPEAIRQLIRRIEDHGGAAKISGAGSLSGAGAGILLVYHPESDVLAWDCLRHLPHYPVRLGAEGVRPEEA